MEDFIYNESVYIGSLGSSLSTGDISREIVRDTVRLHLEELDFDQLNDMQRVAQDFSATLHVIHTAILEERVKRLCR